jgi:cell division control protein 42
LRDDPAVIEKLSKQRQQPITPKQGENLAKDLNAVK